MAKRTYIGKIVGGKLDLHDSRRKQMAQDISRMKEGALVVVEIKYAGKRSLQNNAFYWTVIVPLVCEAMVNLGHDFDDDLTHEFLKVNFHSETITNNDGVFLGTNPGTTTEMNTEEFMIYREKIVRWAAESLQLYIPEPNEQTTLNI